MPVSHTSIKQTRRERGKLAQREYRKRHASTFQNLKEENQSLKDSIRHLTAVAATIHPRQLNPDLGLAIDRLRDIAGLADQYGPVAPAAAAAAAAAVSVTSNDPSHLDILFPVSDSSGGMVSPSSSGPGVLPTTVALGGDPLGAMAGANMHDPSLGFQLSLDGPTPPHHQHHQHHQHQHHQPQHSHHAPPHHHSQHHHQTLPPLPPAPAHPAYEPPSSYEPMFFGQDMFTFAGRLFWDCLTYNFLRTQRLQSGAVTRNDHNPATGTYTMTDDDQEMVASMARTRLQYREPQPDYMMPGLPAAYPHQLQHHQTHQQQHHQPPTSHHYPHHHHMAAVTPRNPNLFPVQVATAENYYLGRCARAGPGSGAPGGPVSSADMAELSAWWKTPAGVEAFVRERLSLDEYRGIEDTLTGRDVSEEGEGRIRMAMQALVPNAIYFPDGPRWNVMYLAMVVGTWVRGIKGGDMNIAG